MALSGIRAVTLDFGNTLVPIDRSALGTVVVRTADQACVTLALGDPSEFLVVWGEERDRQFREELPRFREVNLRLRAVRVVARLRGMSAPPADIAWDDSAASGRSTADEIAMIVESYSMAFVALIPAPPTSGRVIRELAERGFRVAILSNWPLAATIDRFVEAAGWMSDLSAIFVSERIGTIKPHAAIFAHAAASLGLEPAAILHVGDDWAADVTGAAAAGWHSAYLVGHQVDRPLPTSERPAGLRPDVELDALSDLSARLDDPPVARSSGTTA